MNDDDVTISELLGKIADALEEHSKILATHQKLLEQLSGEFAAIKEKVEDLGKANSPKSSDEEFVANITARLKAISSTLDAKP